jgi:ABC-type nitrate/sulfonate/bicarbonate transport system ATPase subunit
VTGDGARRQALATVERLLREGRAVLVLGPTGIGKTTLLAEVAGRLAASGRHVVTSSQPI